MAKGATERYRRLQRASYLWAMEQGFGVVGMEVPVSQVGGKLDVVGVQALMPKRVKGETVLRAGEVAVFECKADRDDFLRDARSEESLREELQQLQVRRREWEDGLRKDFPTLREGQTLFPEYDVYRYADVGGVEYRELVEKIEGVTRQLYVRGKFARILRWRGANLHYVVVEEGVVSASEVPVGWGLLELRGDRLEVVEKAIWQDVEIHVRGVMGVRVAMAATEMGKELLLEEMRLEEQVRLAREKRKSKRNKVY